MTARCRVLGGLEVAAAGPVEVHHPLIKIGQHSEQLIEGDRGHASVQSRDQRLVVSIEPVDDVGDELVVEDGLARRSQLIGVAAHGSEVGGDGEVALLRVDEGGADVVDAAQRLRRVHARQRRPERARRGDRGHRDQHLLGEVAKEEPEHLLVLLDPDGVERVGLRSLLPVLVLGDEKASWFRHGAVRIAKETGPSQLGRDLCPP